MRKSPWAASAAECGPLDGGLHYRSTARLNRMFANDVGKHPLLGLALAAGVSAAGWLCLLSLMV